MTAVQSIFSLPEDATRVSFTVDGAFHYRGVGYAYVIRPTVDGACATLRIAASVLAKFRAVCFRDIQRAKCPDMLITSSGFGWWKVQSMSVAGDTSVHRFFFVLNRWMLEQQQRKAMAEQAVTQHSRVIKRYTLTVTKIGHATRTTPVSKVVAPATTRPAHEMQAAPKPATSATSSRQQVVPGPSADKLEQLVQTVNARYGHVRSQSRQARNIH